MDGRNRQKILNKYNIFMRTNFFFVKTKILMYLDTYVKAIQIYFVNFLKYLSVYIYYKHIRSVHVQRAKALILIPEHYFLPREPKPLITVVILRLE